jgi:hypothetical protein
MTTTTNKPTKTQRNERAILRRVIIDALKAGYELSVDDGGDELAIERSTNAKAVLAALMNTDDDRLILERRIVGVEREHGWVRFIYGNGNDGCDVICDYTVNLDAVLEGATALAEKLEAR